jgi:hypothetical protein
MHFPSLRQLEKHPYVAVVALYETRHCKPTHPWEDPRPQAYVASSDFLTGIGQLVKCLVTKSSFMSFTATMELSADPEQVTNAVADLNDVTLDMLLPGTLLCVSVTKVTGTKLRSIFAVFSFL